MERILASVDRDLAGDWTDKLTTEFGSLGAVLSAGRYAQRRVTKDKRVAVHLELLHEAILETLRQRLQDAPLLPSLDALLDYVRADLAYEPVERMRVFFLDAKARLIRDEAIASGSVDQLVIHPREIVRRAIELGALGLILVHNHPSGDTAPSKADVITTRAIASAVQTIGIDLHDHVIVGIGGWTSMRAEGLL